MPKRPKTKYAWNPLGKTRSTEVFDFFKMEAKRWPSKARILKLCGDRGLGGIVELRRDTPEPNTVKRVTVYTD